MEDNDNGENYEDNDTQILPEDENEEVGDEESVQEVSPRKRRHRRNSRKHDSGGSDSVYGGHRRHEFEDGGHSHKKHRHKSRSSHGGNHRTSIDASNDHMLREDSHDMPSDPADVEDGEILEDGEIPDEVCDDAVHSEEKTIENVPSATIKTLENSSPGHSEGQGSDKEVEEGNGGEEEAEVDSGKDEEGNEVDVRYDRRERKRKRREKREKRRNKDDKKKKKRHDYVDYDRIEEMEQNWPGASASSTSKRSPPAPYDAPYRSPPGPYDSPYKSPPGPYDSPYASPPGPYDSPQYEDEESNARKPQKTLMNMVDDEYVDANIAAEEGTFRKRLQQGNRGRGGARNNKRKLERQHPMQSLKKKPLLETPMDQRPLCKFFREGKCAKGDDCPFNHDFRPPKKPDICKFYLNGSCSKGDYCVFMHNEFPCKYFHMGATCYQGDNCRFNHDPLTEETRPLFEKLMNDNRGEMMEEEEPISNRPHRPSLLGSPPRHIKEQVERMKSQQNVKNIPSIFDIQVFPPGASPQKHPPNSSPPARPPSGFYTDQNEMGPGPQGGSQSHEGSSGPSGSYSQQDSGPYCQQDNGSYGQQDNGSYGQQDNGSYGQPDDGSYDHQNSGHYGQQDNGSYGQQDSGHYGQQDNSHGPPDGSFGPRDGPPRGHPNGPPHGHKYPSPHHGQQGPRMGSQHGPPPGQQHGPFGDTQFGGGPGMMRAPRPGPPVNMPVNTAVAMIGALLRHAAPAMLRPQMNCPPMGSSPVHPGSANQVQEASPHDKPSHQTNEGDQSSDKDGETDDNHTEEQVEGTISKDETEESDGNQHSEDEVLKHLPPKQRELFLRIQQQQQQERQNQQHLSEQSDQEQTQDKNNQKKEGVADDSWYSSDEEEANSSKSGLPDAMRNSARKALPPSNQPATSALNPVMQMINAIRSQSEKAPLPTSADPRMKQTDPRQKHRDPRQQASPISGSDPWQQAKPEYESTTFVTSKEGDIPVYKVYSILIDLKSSVPTDIDIFDPKFKSDPRILKHREKQKVQTDPRLEGKESTERSKDPRAKQSDPRVPKQKEGGNMSEKPVDPRIGRVSSEQIANKPNDPRLQRVQSGPPLGVHNLPVRPVEPWAVRPPESFNQGPGPFPGQNPFPGGGPMGPGQIGQQENFGPNDGPRQIRPFGPRFGGPLSQGGQRMPMGPGPGPGMGPRPRFGPRFSMQGPGPQNNFSFDSHSEGMNRLPFRHGCPPLNRQESAPDPRLGRQDSWVSRQDSGGDPRFDRQDSSQENIFHRQDSAGDPRLNKQDSYRDPRLNRQDSGLDSRRQDLPNDPRLMRQDSGSDPRLNRQDSGVDPRKQDSRSDPRMKKQESGDPRILRKESLEQDSDLQRGNSPRSFSEPLGVIQTTEVEKSPIHDTETLSGPPGITRGFSHPGTDSEKANVQSNMNTDQNKVKFDYRNDPRFRRKPAAESSSATSQLKRKFIGQRKSSMEYSSPLGVDSDKQDSGSGYNSYNRPQLNSNKSQNSGDTNSRIKVENVVSQPVGSVETVPPLRDDLLQPNLAEPQLKDLFKTFDPTASPFC